MVFQDKTDYADCVMMKLKIKFIFFFFFVVVYVSMPCIRNVEAKVSPTKSR